jgi:hypothetical protein
LDAVCADDDVEGQGSADVEGTVASGLSPCAPSSVAPSGIFEPTVVVAALPPGAAGPLVEAEFDDALKPHAFDVPPPSKAGFELVLAQDGASGLIPGVFSSVAPSGMLVDPDDAVVEEGVPSGEVAPMPGVEADCACAAATAPKQIKSVIINRRHIASSLSDFVRQATRPMHPIELVRKHAAGPAGSLSSPPAAAFGAPNCVRAVDGFRAHLQIFGDAR